MELDTLRQRFLLEYPGAAFSGICRAPGRVNLIGEHTDYNGLPVLPMTLAQEIHIAYAPRNDRQVRMRNINPEFPEVSFTNAPDIPASPPGTWDNYCKAAFLGINDALEPKQFPGADMLVGSDLPMAAGLSSSSALVVACALAYLDLLGSRPGNGMTTVQLAEILSEAEHYVGTRGGGMDQAVILNGESGHACKIDFFPLRVEKAPLPQDCMIVVCDSMVKVKKSGAALARYNAGPRLCALACALVERQVREEFDDEITLERLGDLWFGPLCLMHREAEEICLRATPEARMELDTIAKRLGCSIDEVRQRWLGDLPEPDGGFPIQARLRHQWTEYRRVEYARDALHAGDAALFGRLMNASHESCHKDFEISCPELDALVEAARDCGALGARLTGAGFGGATVNLVPRSICDDFIDGITHAYYREYCHFDGKPPVFVAHATSGAGYL